jgi:two-component system sensor histidine kinase MtrB
VKQSSLFARLGAGVAALVVAQSFLALSLGILAFRLDAGRPRDALVEQGMVLARFALTPSSPEGTAERLSELSRLEGFALARYDSNGTLLHSTRPEAPVPPQLAPDHMARARELQGRPVMVLGRGPQEPTLALGVLPPDADATFVGLFESSTSARIGRGVRAAFLAQGLALVVLTLGVTWWLSARARKTLREVERVVTAVAEGRFSEKLPVRGSDEVARVADGFNRMAARLEGTIEELRRAEARRTRMFAAITHELATPLTSVLGYLESLGMPEVDADVAVRHRYADVAFAQARALEALVEDLSTLSRIDFHELDLAPTRFDLASLVRAEVAPFESRGAARGVTLFADLPQELEAEFDPGRVGQVVRNLLDNAVRHARGLVRVSLSLGDELLVLVVNDDGPGVPAEQLGLLGEPLLRVDGSRSRRTGGRGLGLSIAAGIVRAHGGSLTFESTPGHGLEARVTLPRWPSVAASAHETTATSRLDTT